MANGTRWENGKWVLGLTQSNRDDTLALLTEEYKEVNADWRLRDKYVEDKFMQSVFVFALIATLLAAVVTALHVVPEGTLRSALPLAYPAGFVLFSTLFFFAFVMLISLVKDTYYRDGSERMARLLLGVIEAELGCNCISVLRQAAEDPLRRDHPAEGFGPFTRKIQAPAEGRAKLGMPFSMERVLSRRKTFRWITAYYGLVTLGCLALSLISLTLWIRGS